MPLNLDHKQNSTLLKKFGDLISNGSEEIPFRYGIGKPFDFTFVWFKPFFKVSSVNISDYKPMRNESFRNPDGLDFHTVEELAFNEGELIPWAKILSELGISHFGKIEQGIKSQWGSLKQEYSDSPLGKMINDYCSQNNILELNDNCITSLEERLLIELISQSDGKEIIYFDYTATEIDKIKINKNIYYNQNQMPFMSDKNQSFFVASYYDDYFILINGNEKLEQQIRSHPFIEGFFCNEYTTETWWLEPDRQIGEIKSISH